MTIYTKTGDKGETSLLGGGRVSKSDSVFEVLGTLDELNATLSFLANSRLKEVYTFVDSVQNTLFELGAIIANPKSKEKDFEPLILKTKEIEKFIDKLEKKLPKLTNFILPRGSMDANHLHVSRAVCRRLERLMVSHSGKLPLSHVVVFINRLSDALFVLARYSNLKLRYNETIWKK